VLILIAGLCALLAGMSLAFLVRMRGDIEESRAVVADAQARIMLVAGCDYILEAGRLGWEKDPAERETYGWVDVRDGLMGPKTRSDHPVAGLVPQPRAEDGPPSPNFPIGSYGRFPMFVWARTRYATRLTAAYNPIATDPADAATFGMPFLRNPDPQPAAGNGWPGAVSAARFDANTVGDYVHGDPTPRANSTGMAWFRVYRRGPDRFIVTCGAGGSMGFKDWHEVQAEEASGRTPGATGAFGDETMFRAVQDQEVRFWYLVEWSPAVGGATYQCVDNEQAPDHYQWRPFNPIHENYNGGGHQSQTHARNMLGTLRFIQRLRAMPDAW
jgi:hypothetical protein